MSAVLSEAVVVGIGLDALRTAHATAPSDLLRSIDSHDLAGVWPVFGATNESRAYRILEYIIPLGSVALVAPQQMIVKAWLPEGT